MKSLHLTNFWHSTSGGIATFYRSLMQAAELRGHFMTLVIPGQSDCLENVGAHSRIYQVASPPAPFNPHYRIISPRTYLGRGSRLRQILNAEQPDLVEVCDKYTLNYFAGMLRARMLGDVDCHPVVVGLSCERMDDNVRAYLGWNGIASRLVRFYMRWLYFAMFDQHIANSHYTAEELRPASIGHRIRRGVWVRPMGVDLNDLSPTHRSSVARHHLLKRTGAGGDALLLLYVGRLVPEKNIGLLLETLGELQARGGRDWRLLVAGDGVERPPFLAEAASRGLSNHVIWLGHIQDRKELAQIYANCDVFLHPNPHEPFGIAPLEAMASGLPLIAPNSGGVVSYANSTNAWIVPATAPAFADALRDIISDRALRERRVANALLTVENFRWQNLANSFLDLYKDLHKVGSGDLPHLPPEFVSMPRNGLRSRMAVMTAWFFQRLLTTRQM